MNKIFFLLFLVSVVAACQSSKYEEVQSEAQDGTKLVSTVNTPQQQYSLAKHFWDKYTFPDSISPKALVSFEQSLDHYIQLLNTFPLVQSKQMMKEFLAKKITSANIIDKTGKIFEDYLYNPVSPLRNDELYSVFLKHKLSFPGVEAINLVRPKYQLNIIAKNRVGHLAENFSYTTPHSKKNTLFNVKGKYTLLFFYDPECPYCKDTKLKMEHSHILQQLKSSPQNFNVLAICIAPDQNKWLNYISTLPLHWISGHNAEIANQQRYDLRALPSLYLLDKDKKVILKDATFWQIESKLNELKQKGHLLP